MREYPWHSPKGNLKEHQWYRNIVDFHELTLAWWKELEAQYAVYQLGRGLPNDIAEKHWTVKSLQETELEQFLNDSTPDRVLLGMERNVWSVQAATLLYLLEKITKDSERDSLRALLTKVSWNYGRKLAENRWGTDLFKKSDIRVLLAGLSEAPISAGSTGVGFLVRRALEGRAEIELTTCPHQRNQEEVRRVADELCTIHGGWISGFIYGLNNKVVIEATRQTPRCLQNWRILQ